jgi:hypothetical protein
LLFVDSITGKCPLLQKTQFSDKGKFTPLF